MPGLNGKRVLVTREAGQAKEFSRLIKAAGGLPVQVPLLKINCKKFASTKAFPSYDWLIFTSTNGVDCFLKQLTERERKLIKDSQIAVVGHKTAEALSNYELTADLIPEVYDAVSLSEVFLEKYHTGESILLIRGNKSRDVLPAVFSDKGIEFDTVEVYETIINERNSDLLQQAVLEEKLDFITFTSPSTVEAFHELAGKQKKELFTCVCIGTTTQAAAKKFGFRTIITAETFTVEGMIKAMQAHK